MMWDRCDLKQTAMLIALERVPLLPKPCGLKHNMHNETGVVDQVTLPEPSRLSHQPKQPFQPMLAHPRRRLRQGARDNVESLPHS